MQDTPPGFVYVRRTVSALRRTLCDEVQQARGEVTLYDDKLILDICRHERRSMLYAGWLREANESELDDLEGREPRRHQLPLKRLQPLSLMECVTIEEKIGHSTEASTRALAKLGLDKRDVDDWSAILHSVPIVETPVNGAQLPAQPSSRDEGRGDLNDSTPDERPSTGRTEPDSNAEAEGVEL